MKLVLSMSSTFTSRFSTWRLVAVDSSEVPKTNLTIVLTMFFVLRNWLISLLARGFSEEEEEEDEEGTEERLSAMRKAFACRELEPVELAPMAKVARRVMVMVTRIRSFILGWF